MSLNRRLILLFFAFSLAACSTVRPHRSGRMGLFDLGDVEKGGGDRSWLKRREPRLPPISHQSPSTQEFEQVRLQRWKQVAQSIQLSWPVKKARLTSQFGWRKGEAHDGVDLRAKVGTPVFAAHDGRVLYAGNGISGYGVLVVIRHSTGLATVYAHNSRIRVRRGQSVRRGQMIALSGATGRASGPHVHFEVRAGSRPLDPRELIQTSAGGRSQLASLD